MTSRALLGELARILRDKFDTSVGEQPLFQAYRDRATVVRRARLPHPICRDRDDDKVLETAVAGRADIILTGDEDLLVLRKYRGIRILAPREFVELMDRESQELRQRTRVQGRWPAPRTASPTRSAVRRRTSMSRCLTDGSIWRRFDA